MDAPASQDNLLLCKAKGKGGAGVEREGVRERGIIRGNGVSVREILEREGGMGECFDTYRGGGGRPLPSMGELDHCGCCCCVEYFAHSYHLPSFHLHRPSPPLSSNL